MRWLSPPDSVPDARASVRYSSPTSTRNLSRSRISFNTRTAISFCLGLSRPGSSVNHSPACLTDISATSPMCRPPTFTHSASGLSRKPLQAAQGISVKYFAISSRPVAVGLAPAPLESGDDAFERLRGLIGAQPVVVDEADRVLARAMKKRVLRLLRQVLPFGVERELVVLAQRLQRLDVIGRGRFRPGRDRAAAQGLVLVGNDEIGVDMLLDAKPAAGRTGAERVIEREQPRLDLGNGEA